MATAPTKNEKENKITKIRDKKAYFCPYCDALFIDKTDYKIQKGSSNNYKCLVCESQYFNHAAYLDAKKESRKFHIKKNSDEKEVTLFIKRTVMGFKKDGFSHKEIQEITHFPRSMINNITKIHAKADRSMTLETFLHKELMIGDDESKNIIKAIGYGCSYDFISKLFDVSRRVVTQASSTYKKNATAQEKKTTDTFKKSYTILLEEGKKVVIKEKK